MDITPNRSFSFAHVTLHNKKRISGIIWDSFKATPPPDISDGHWLLLVGDLRERSFLIYDSLPSPAAKSRWELVDSTMSCLSMLWLRIALLLEVLNSTTYIDAGLWDVITPKCPEQRNGHDYGVVFMAFIDFLPLKVDGFEFDQACVAHYRDKYLLRFQQGRVAHFPQHLRVLSPTSPIS
ncbi:hypothetical protein Cgig2_032851 [Carnegiea gigantea]|uniref:Ubiquitin-like protease family profile domain-containing protein n=1 Tax=Carnegiea gigantea TaxID=171969 RepID=A0A9Q1GU27_9CARY|nr:hypothetical protein Cgig2_032851 [Carnegiea gigantea]